MEIKVDLGEMVVGFDVEDLKKELEIALPQIWTNKLFEMVLKDIEDHINNDASLPRAVVQMKEGIKMKVINEIREILKAAEEKQKNDK